MVKFGDRAKHLYRKLLGCFEGHPLAARVAGCVYMAHGGLFRQVEPTPSKKSKLGKSYRYDLLPLYWKFCVVQCF